MNEKFAPQLWKSQIWGLPASGPLAGHGGAVPCFFKNASGYRSAAGAPLQGRRCSSQI